MTNREVRIVALFATLVALGSAAVLCALRAGFGIDVTALAVTLGLAMLLVNAPFTFDNETAPAHRALIALAVLVLTVVAGIFAGTTWTGLALAIAGLILAVRNARFVLQGGDRVFTVYSALFVLLAILWTSGVSWGANLLNPLSVENVALHGGSAWFDSYYHAGIANMIGTYGVASSGLDGFPFVQYHFGSHVVFRAWASLTGLPMLRFYSHAFPLIVPVLYVVAFAILIDSIRRARRWTGSPISSAKLASGFFAVVMVGALPLPLGYAGGFGLGPFFSESYGFALAILFLFLAEAVNALSLRVHGRASPVAMREAFTALLVIPLGIALVGFMKVAIMPLAVIAFLYVVVRHGLYRKPVWLVSAVLAGLSFVVASKFIVPRGYEQQLQLFAYLRYVLPLRWWPFFLSLHLLWTWVYAAIRFRQEGVTDFGTLRSALSRRKIIDVEALVLIAVLGLGPGTILPLSLEAIFFSDPQRWVAVALILGDLAVLAWLAGKWKSYRESGLFGWSPTRISGLFLGLPLVLCFVVTLFQWPLQMARANLATRKEAALLAGSPDINLRLRLRQMNFSDLFEPSVLDSGVRRGQRAGIVSAMEAVARLPHSEKRRSAVYIPKSVDAYWRILPDSANCSYAPFVAPAFTEVALLDGLPPSWCPTKPGYGMNVYAASDAEQRVVMRSDDDLCRRAARWDVTQVIVIQPAKGEENNAWPVKFALRKVRCG